MAATEYTIQFAVTNVGTPAFDYFVRPDTWASITNPTITAAPVGNGLFYFGFDWTTAPAGVTKIYYLAELNSEKVTGTITAPLTPIIAGAAVPQPPTPTGTTGLWTLAALRTAAQQRADMQNAPIVTTDEWTSYVNQSALELYGILLQHYGDDYFIQMPPYQFQTVAGQDTYPFPPNFLKLVGVDLSLTATNDGWTTMYRFENNERNNYIFPNFQSYLGVSDLRYRPRGNSLLLSPIPAGGQFIRLWYVPRLQELVTDNDTLDGFSGWTEYVIVDAAIKGRIKEETDTAPLERAKEFLRQRIEAEAQNRDAGLPKKVQRTRQQFGGPGPGGYWGGPGSWN